MMTKENAAITDFAKSIERLRESLTAPKTELHRDAAIQRFEFTFDLAWKLIKTVLEERHTTICVSPKTCFREAYKKALIPYDDAWIKWLMTAT